MLKRVSNQPQLFLVQDLITVSYQLTQMKFSWNESLLIHTIPIFNLVKRKLKFPWLILSLVNIMHVCMTTIGILALQMIIHLNIKMSILNFWKKAFQIIFLDLGDRISIGFLSQISSVKMNLWKTQISIETTNRKSQIFLEIFMNDPLFKTVFTKCKISFLVTVYY